jgi:hypothetical protein
MAQTPRRCTVGVDSATHSRGSVFLNSKKLLTQLKQKPQFFEKKKFHKKNLKKTYFGSIL